MEKATFFPFVLGVEETLSCKGASASSYTFPPPASELIRSGSKYERRGRRLRHSAKSAYEHNLMHMEQSLRHFALLQKYKELVFRVMEA